MYAIVLFVFINVGLIRSQSIGGVKFVGSDYENYRIDCTDCRFLTSGSTTADFCFQNEEQFTNRVILANGTELERTFDVKIYSKLSFDSTCQSDKRCSKYCRYSITTHDYGTVFSFMKNGIQLKNVTIKWVPNDEINLNVYEADTSIIKCIDSLTDQLPSIDYQTSIKGSRTENESLILPTLTESDNGVINCSATFDTEPISRVERVIYLTVVKPLVVKSLTKLIERKAGQTVTLQCLIESYSLVQVHWYKDGYKLFSGHKYTSHLHEVDTGDKEYKINVVGVTNTKTSSLAEIIVHNIEGSDSGVYICQVENEIVVKTDEINLLVTQPLNVHW